jgi:asparagine synthase (glutamine-hydrolysing)
MAHSLEIRLPFLDHRLVEFVVGLPPEMKITGGWTKFLLRHSMSQIPQQIRWRRDKQGFVTAERKWLAQELSGLIGQRFHKSTLGEMGIVDDRAFLERYSRFRDGDHSIGHPEIGRVLMAELWLKTYFR